MPFELKARIKMEETTVRVSDLGASAYLLMHGYNCLGKDGRDILFKVEEDGVKELEQRKMEYLTSEFHRFDACLMSLKKM